MVVGLFPASSRLAGAYVFLDPAYPKERLIFMLENIASAVDSATAG